MPCNWQLAKRYAFGETRLSERMRSIGTPPSEPESRVCCVGSQGGSDWLNTDAASPQRSRRGPERASRDNDAEFAAVGHMGRKAHSPKVIKAQSRYHACRRR